MLSTVGKEVVMLSYPNLLFQYSASRAGSLATDVRFTTFHRWFRGFWRQHFDRPPPEGRQGEWSYDWSEVLRLLPNHRTARSTLPSLVIDEGQDLPRDFYLLCTALGADVSVFADENRCIGDRQSTLNEMRARLGAGLGEVRLDGDHRSTQEVARLASHYRAGTASPLPAPARSHTVPLLVRMRSLDEFAEELIRYARAHPQSGIGVLCRTAALVGTLQYKLAQRRHESHVQAYVSNDVHRSRVNFDRPGILITSASTARGLEFDSLFVPDLEQYTEDPTTLDSRFRFQAMISRAREEVYLAYVGSQEPRIVADVPADVLKRAN
ncbi:hypothetical protein [Streptomyces bugieae]|uniref:DNA helicase n=1 Tax=Streptomyces bugieae TaxID=3098223 RepID=A0ABU7P032_9ACTN|nr:hypothetical protein [Streptomyces sp. DSM 41528]